MNYDLIMIRAERLKIDMARTKEKMDSAYIVALEECKKKYNDEFILARSEYVLVQDKLARFIKRHPEARAYSALLPVQKQPEGTGGY